MGFLIDNIISRGLYKIAVYCRPLAVRIIPQKTRQRIRRLLTGGAVINIRNETLQTKAEQFIDGVNLVGYSRAEMGIGESCRLAAKSLDATDLSFGIMDFKGTTGARMSDLTWINKEITNPIYSVNLFHINAEEMKDVYTLFGASMFENRYNIGYWHWELPDFPDEWLENFNFVNEIWVPSTFVGDSISIKSPVPVVKIPHSIEVKITEPRDRKYFELPDNCFLFLAMYDIKSFHERKNPKAAIEAFKLSFQPTDKSVGLVVKVNVPKGTPEDLREIKEIIEGYENIYLIDKTISRNDVNALISVTDSFVSLHRSEGFGLVLAEAMYLGKPVIGTNWSSNTDFMNANNSCLVDYQLISLGKDYGPYKAYQHWADPDIEHASKYMNMLVNDLDYYKNLSVNGEQYIKQYHSPKRIGDLIRNRLAHIKKWHFGG